MGVLSRIGNKIGVLGSSRIRKVAFWKRKKVLEILLLILGPWPKRLPIRKLIMPLEHLKILVFLLKTSQKVRITSRQKIHLKGSYHITLGYLQDQHKKQAATQIFLEDRLSIKIRKCQRNQLMKLTYSICFDAIYQNSVVIFRDVSLWCPFDSPFSIASHNFIIFSCLPSFFTAFPTT